MIAASVNMGSLPSSERFCRMTGVRCFADVAGLYDNLGKERLVSRSLVRIYWTVGGNGAVLPVSRRGWRRGLRPGFRAPVGTGGQMVWLQERKRPT
jgi:hypothetical protein